MRHIRFFLAILLLPASASLACDTPYPPTMIKSFMQHCAEDRSMTRVCGCVIQKLQTGIPLDEFIEAGEKPGGVNADPRFVRVSRECETIYWHKSAPVLR